MLEPLTFASEDERKIGERLIADIRTNALQRPLGTEFSTKEGLQIIGSLFGSFFQREENEYYLRYQIPTERGYKGVEVKYLVKGEELIYQGDTMDWELKW